MSSGRIARLLHPTSDRSVALFVVRVCRSSRECRERDATAHCVGSQLTITHRRARSKRFDVSRETVNARNEIRNAEQLSPRVRKPQVSPMPRRFPTQARTSSVWALAKVRRRSPARKSNHRAPLLQPIAQRCSGVSRETMRASEAKLTRHEISSAREQSPRRATFASSARRAASMPRA